MFKSTKAPLTCELRLNTIYYGTAALRIYTLGPVLTTEDVSPFIVGA